MGRRRHTPEQIITALREAEVGLANGKTAAMVSRELGISEQTYYRWRKEFGGMKVDQARRLKDLERENAHLKRTVANLTVDKLILEEAATTCDLEETRRDAIASSITTLPEQLRRSLTWDQGAEMAQHAQLRIDTGLAVYFCDPQSPWQRGTNENTNGLLRQYFPKGTDLSKHTADDLAAVAAALNSRPRKTLGWKTPAETLEDLLHR